MCYTFFESFLISPFCTNNQSSICANTINQILLMIEISFQYPFQQSTDLLFMAELSNTCYHGFIITYYCRFVNCLL